MLMKLLGALCAFAATGTVLVYGFGLQVQRPIPPLEAPRVAPPPTPRSQAVVPIAPVQAPAPISEQVTDQVTEQVTEQITVNAPVQAPAQASELTPAAPLETIEVVTEVAAEVAAEVEAEQVFVFWQPFRSRGSAQGFAQGLSARAEVPISVISEDTELGRQYRVVLPYDSEAQRLERLAKLEIATRLKMGE